MKVEPMSGVIRQYQPTCLEREFLIDHFKQKKAMKKHCATYNIFTLEKH